MHFGLSEHEQTLKNRVVAFCDEHCSEQSARGLDESGEYPFEMHQALCQSGILGHCLPSSHGGGNGGLVDLAIICETLGAHSSLAMSIFFVNMAVGTLLSRAGTEGQSKEFLEPLIRGEFRSCFSLTEPSAGSDASAIETRAVLEGDDYVLNGTKLWATGASVANSILVVARTSDAGRANQATSLFLVPAESDGLVTTPLDKLAGNAMASCRLEFRDVRVPISRRIGEEGKGWGFLAHTGAVERLTVAAGNLGAAQTVFGIAKQFATDRSQFGQPVSKFQAISHKLVDMATEIEAMRWLVYSAAWKVDQGHMGAKEISMAKLYTSDHLNDMAMTGMRILGGRAYQKGQPMERILRESILSLYAGGTAEIQRNIIARRLGL